MILVFINGRNLDWKLANVKLEIQIRTKLETPKSSGEMVTVESVDVVGGEPLLLGKQARH